MGASKNKENSIFDFTEDHAHIFNVSAVPLIVSQGKAIKEILETICTDFLDKPTFVAQMGMSLFDSLYIPPENAKEAYEKLVEEGAVVPEHWQASAEARTDLIRGYFPNAIAGLREQVQKNVTEAYSCTLGKYEKPDIQSFKEADAFFMDAEIFLQSISRNRHLFFTATMPPIPIFIKSNGKELVEIAKQLRFAPIEAKLNEAVQIADSAIENLGAIRRSLMTTREKSLTLKAHNATINVSKWTTITSLALGLAMFFLGIFLQDQYEEYKKNRLIDAQHYQIEKLKTELTIQANSDRSTNPIQRPNLMQENKNEEVRRAPKSSESSAPAGKKSSGDGP